MGNLSGTTAGLLTALALAASPFAAPATAAPYRIDESQSVFAVLTHKAGIGSGLAHDHLIVALRSRLRHGFRGAAADAVAAIAVRCAVGDDLRTATVLFGAAESVRGVRRAPQFSAFWSEQQAALRRMLGDQAFDAAYADGAGLGFTRAVTMALAVEHPDLEYGSVRFADTLG